MSITFKNQERINWVDTAKGIGIFLVVFAHVNSSLSDQIYLFHMPLFFFLSGMFFKNNQDFKHFILNKIQYLILPFIIFLIISIPMRILYFTLIDVDFSFREIIKPSTSNVPLWFLPVLFLLNVILYFKKFRYLNYIIFIAMIYGVLTFGNNRFHFQAFSKIIYCLIFFASGNLFLQNIKFFMKNRKVIFFISLLIFLYGIYLSLHQDFRFDFAANRADGGGIMHLIIAISGIGSVIYACIYLNEFLYKKIPEIITFINYLGLNSLYIFGLHWIFIQPILLFYPQDKIQDYSLLMTFLLIGISVGIGQVLKRSLPRFLR